LRKGKVLEAAGNTALRTEVDGGAHRGDDLKRLEEIHVGD